MKMVKKITALLMLLLLCLPMMLPGTEISALAAGASVAKASAQTTTVRTVESSAASTSAASTEGGQASEGAEVQQTESAGSQQSETTVDNQSESTEDDQLETTADQQTESAETQQTETASKSTKSKNSNGVISTDEFEIRVVCGLNGNYRTGASIPVTIYMESLKEDFEGTVRIIVPKDTDYYDTEAVAYEKDVLLSAGTQKVVTMSISCNNGLTAFRFQLENSKGEIVVENTVTMKSQAGEKALVGVLSDDYTALNYFDGISISLDSYTGMTQLLELNEDTLPEQTSGLEALSYLIINSFDTSKLTQNQYTAIKNWVEQGGVLILGTGSDYKQTLSGFQDDFVKGTVGDAMEGSFQAISASSAQKSDPLKFTKEQGIMEISLEEGSALKGVVSADKYVWNQDYGKGHVVVTAFNLGMEPIVSWGGRLLMASALLQESAEGYSDTRISNLNYGGYYTDSWSLSSALDRLHNVGYPDMEMIVLIFMLFVILVGPGLYLLLKLMDKREWMWALIPILAVGCTAVIFVVSKDMRIDNLRTSSITTLYYEDGISNGVQQVNLAVQVPQANRQEVVLDPSLTNLRMYGQNYDYSYYYYGTTTSDSDSKYEYKTAIRETAEGYQLGIENGSTFASTYLSVNHVTDDSEDITCGLETNLDRKTTGIIGTITNNTGRDLHWLSIYAQSRMVMIGELKAGETVEIKETDNRIFQYDIYNISVPGYTVDSKEYNKEMGIWDLFCSQYLYGMGAEDIYVYASMGEWDADYIPDDSVEEQNIAVLVKHEMMGYSDYENAELVSLYDYAKNYGTDWDVDGMMYSQTAEVEFDVSTQVSTVHALIRAKDSEAMYGSTKNVTIYGYNVTTDKYEQLFTDGETMKFEETCPYLSETGIIKLKFVCKTIYEDYSPQITLVGGDE